ncbi:MAG: hypothetical protein HC850_09260 [Rhodomicrobium sp.]|nr:hypothetical protein [Rhodomicrobium sp.]
MLNKAIQEDAQPAAPARACCGGRKQSLPEPKRLALTDYLVQYQPIVVIAGSALLGSLLLPAGHQHADGLAKVMSIFMGLFLFPLALLKLFDIAGFAAAFRRYDIVAKAVPAYGLAFPFIELALALAFLSGLWPTATHVSAMIIGAVGTVGIVQTLSRGEKLQCACVGSAIKVPLGSVSIMENTGMALMAAILLLV